MKEAHVISLCLSHLILEGLRDRNKSIFNDMDQLFFKWLEIRKEIFEKKPDNHPYDVHNWFQYDLIHIDIDKNH